MNFMLVELNSGEVNLPVDEPRCPGPEVRVARQPGRGAPGGIGVPEDQERIVGHLNPASKIKRGELWADMSKLHLFDGGRLSRDERARQNDRQPQ